MNYVIDIIYFVYLNNSCDIELIDIIYIDIIPWCIEGYSAIVYVLR